MWTGGFSVGVRVLRRAQFQVLHIIYSAGLGIFYLFIYLYIIYIFCKGYPPAAKLPILCM